MKNQQVYSQFYNGRFTFLGVILINLFCVSALVCQAGEVYQKKISVVVNPGNTQRALGLSQTTQEMVQQADIPSAGPESFFVDARGNTYICDTLNQRIQVFSTQGVYQTTINLAPETVASDVVVDGQGNLYVYDDVQGKLSQYSAAGVQQASIAVDYTRWSSRMPMYIFSNVIYMRTPDQESIPIGKIESGRLQALSASELAQPGITGTYGNSGKRYIVRMRYHTTGEIDVLDSNGAVLRTLSVAVQNLASIMFLQEDAAGNIYIQTERFEPPNKVILEVHKFDVQGNYLSLIPIPENNYGTWTVKLLSVSQQGDIHQMLPTGEQVYLQIFQRQQ